MQDVTITRLFVFQRANIVWKSIAQASVDE
jgi:hypothetical protein